MNPEEFVKFLKDLGINLKSDQLEKLVIYKDFLKEYNKHTNLTTIIEDEDIYLKHFYDSLTLVKAIDLTKIETLLDIGSGAGFPGMVIKIVFPNIKVTLLDSNNKKTKFLEQLKEKLNLDVTIVNDRAENYVKENLNKFDVVTSRAVANLRVLSELSIPYVKNGGLFIALKGNLKDELIEAKDTIEILHAFVREIIFFELFEGEGTRNIIVIQKFANTNINELRTYDKILKKPLKKNSK